MLGALHLLLSFTLSRSACPRTVRRRGNTSIVVARRIPHPATASPAQELERSTVVSNGVDNDDNVLAVDQRQSVQVWLPDTCCTVA